MGKTHAPCGVDAHHLGVAQIGEGWHGGAHKHKPPFFPFFSLSSAAPLVGPVACSTLFELSDKELLKYIQKTHMRLCFSKGKGGVRETGHTRC